MNEITNVLYWISTGLLVPVIVLLLVFFIRALLLIGTFYGQYMQNIKQTRKLKTKIDSSKVDTINKLIDEIDENNKGMYAETLRKLLLADNNSVYYDKILNDFESECQKDLSGSQTLAKLGPVLGLMGTLIPMGPALVGLAAGDIASMASNMQVAFATTVIGLLVGAVGFVIMQVKKRWYVSYLNDLEFVANLLQQNKI